MRTDHKEILFLKKHTEHLSPDEEAELQSLLTESDENRQEMLLVEQVAITERAIREMALFNLSEGYAGMMKKTAKRRAPIGWITLLTRVAAMLAIPLLIATLALGHKVHKQYADLNRIEWMEVSAAPGVVSKFELPDHSIVWLNAGSTLRYPSRFVNNRREVELKGEGYFKVQSDRENPFYVSTPSGVQVMAHGTQFNVNAYHDSDKTEVVLEEGKVDFLLADKNLYQMRPGEQAQFSRSSRKLSVNATGTHEKTAWREGKIIFRNASLEEVFAQLSRRYNVDIAFHDPHKQSLNYRCRVTFTTENIQQIFSYLKLAAPLEWEISTPAQQNDLTLARQRIDVWLKK